MKSNQTKFLHCVLFTLLIILTSALAVNNYNSGVYEDSHFLLGGTTGWFHPNGMLMLFLALILSILYSVYLSNKIYKTVTKHKDR